VLSREFRWDLDGVDILGSVPIKTSGSFFQFPIYKGNLVYLKGTTSTALSVFLLSSDSTLTHIFRLGCRLISVVGFLDSIVSAKQNGGRFGYSISPNRELVALGAANIAASFVPGTLPAYGSITRYAYPC
jgi:MFS superfamily sulfate permease-like transporter